jgi:hypothetical protein
VSGFGQYPDPRRRRKDTGDPLSRLDCKAGTLQVLVYLYGHTTGTETSIARFLQHRPETIAKTLEMLEGLGLVLWE